ncbi:hypothetical protein PR003_g21366 [Phytophthora rubi]|uniref:Uncharacterized protein n=1 Tax=Phytophthora rubi TaxID=129364 RepID=A0A6A4DER6_9STRA|nr:hypothetical protein PR002_g20812 [Phytophthora rubi]KAE8994996.1 hypothetical protein PR001_g20234 [Phytophthora rubi]KAE9305914.1 hypothetical protein PR003_g21366 [Phytophthora rubi]
MNRLRASTLPITTASCMSSVVAVPPTAIEIRSSPRNHVTKKAAAIPVLKMATYAFFFSRH